MARSGSAALVLGLLAAGLVMAQEEPPEVVQKAEESSKSDASEQERRERQEAEDAREAATMTPVANRPGEVAQVVSGTLSLPPLVLGRRPYNCLHWSFCRADGWSQPMWRGPWTLISVRQLLEREGFSTTPVDCATAGGHVCMLIWNVPLSAPSVPPDRMPTDKYWVHAMKRVEGRWSSKNGERGHYEDIADTSGFLDRHYPVPPGHRRVIRCFAKL